MRDKLIQLLNVDMSGCEGDYAEEMADYLIKNGVIVLHCEIGDIVYQTDGVRVYELEILDIYLYKNRPYYETEGIDFDEDAIGTSIFLTKEEAEQKIKELRGKQ